MKANSFKFPTLFSVYRQFGRLYTSFVIVSKTQFSLFSRNFRGDDVKCKNFPRQENVEFRKEIKKQKIDKL